MIKPDTFHVISLGCAKNLVDSSVISQLLTHENYSQLETPSQANFIIVNTCGFIHDARDESLTTLKKLARKKKPGQFLIASGCLSQRYQQDLLREVPQIDGLMGTRNLTDILTLITKLRQQKNDQPQAYFPYYSSIQHVSQARLSAVQGHSAYLKIADGCRRSCAFCAIPAIKGPMVSRTPEAILEDALDLQAQGVKEINLIAQDVTDYGRDLDGWNLVRLLETLLPRLDKVRWLRLLYTYPGFDWEALLNLLAGSDQLLPYLDIPLQHASPAVLQSMRRPSDIHWVQETLAKMRERLPTLAVRTTMIVGFPTETEKEFLKLRDFVESMGFDHLGVFTYSREVGTPAAELGDPIPLAEKNARRAELMRLQEAISFKKNQNLLGSQMMMLVDGIDDRQKIAIGRTYRDAPEVDGLVVANGTAAVGDLLPVRVTGAMAHDLFAEIIPAAKRA